MIIPGNIEFIYIGFNDSVTSHRKNPLNPLSGPVRKKLIQDFQQALSQPAIEAIVLLGSGKHHFSAGADISEFNKPPSDDEEDYPTLVDVVNLISYSKKPVIAGIRGVCLGGGMEVALAADFRIGDITCKMGLPEVKIGLIPGAHGTQRLPRIVSPSIALNLITTGKMFSSVEALEHKLLKVVAKDEPLENACVHFSKWAVTMASISKLPKIHTVKAPNALIKACDLYKQKLPPKQMGTEAIHGAIAAIRACATSSSYEEGCAVEEKIFWDLLLNSPQGRGYRHAFFNERAAQKRNLPAPAIATAGHSLKNVKVVMDPKSSIVGVIGAGTMGSGIALSFLLSRSQYKNVILVDVNAEGLKRGEAFIRKTLKKRRKDAAISKLITSTSLDDLHPCHLVIEAVFENLKLKQDIFGKLQDIVKDKNAILASNTSTLSIDAIVEKIRDSRDKARCAGMHFFSPAHLMKLVEIVYSSYSAKETLVALRLITKSIAKVGVVVGNCDGFVGNRMVAPYTSECAFVALDIGTGESISMVDNAIGRKNRSGNGFGMALGPFGKNKFIFFMNTLCT